jgi:hypothetical protein
MKPVDILAAMVAAWRVGALNNQDGFVHHDVGELILIRNNSLIHLGRPTPES